MAANGRTRPESMYSKVAVSGGGTVQVRLVMTGSPECADGLTQALAAEFGPQGVRVNAILPGAVDTDMYRSMNDTAESQAFVTNLHALKRVASPEELARSASLVDGGASITRS